MNLSSNDLYLSIRKFLSDSNIISLSIDLKFFWEDR